MKKGKSTTKSFTIWRYSIKKENEDGKKTWETQTQAVGLDYSGVADITGDGIKVSLWCHNWCFSRK
ncbi:hypothetical protein KHA80_22525 [Anaerobacillus sp. HL2]|nr:hypothetical protein KHA80_22525 [Anaerobacillus sp. HL2]